MKWKKLYRFRDRLPEKLRYLADAPQQDPGRQYTKPLCVLAVKQKQQYVAAERQQGNRLVSILCGWQMELKARNNLSLP